MDVIRFELRKVYRKKAFWLVIGAALLLHLLLLWWNAMPAESAPSHAEYREFCQQLREIPPDEQIGWLQEKQAYWDAVLLKETWENSAQASPALTDAMEKYPAVFAEAQDYELARRQIALVEEALGEAETVYDYEGYLDGIEDTAYRTSHFSVFGQDEESFSYRNILKTAEDFQKMRGTPITYDANRGIAILLHNPIGDLLLVMTAVFLSLCFVAEEKQKNLFRLIKTMPGGESRTVFAKLSAMGAGIIGASLAFFFVSFLVAHLFYGLGDLSRSIQSVPELIGSTLPLSVGQYLLLLLGLKTFGLLVIGIWAFVLALLCRHPVITLLGDVAVGALSWALTRIPPLSAWNWFKHLNLATLAEPYSVWKEYLNLNFFGFPLPAWAWHLGFAAAPFLAGIGISVLLSHFNRTLSYRTLPRLWLRRRPARPHGLLGYELRKVFLVNRVGVILLLFALLQIVTVVTAERRQDPLDYAYSAYMHRLEGPVTEDKAAFIEEENRYFQEAAQTRADLQQQYINGQIDSDTYMQEMSETEYSPVQYQAFRQVYDRYAYLKGTDGGGCFVYDAGYNQLFGITDSSVGFNSSLRLVLVFALIFCGVFAMEYESGVFRILCTVPQNTFGSKLAASGIAGACAFLLAYGADIAQIAKNYGLPALWVSTESLPALSAYGNLPLWGYLALLLGIRFVVCAGLMCLCLVLSKLLKNRLWSALASFGLFALPFFIHWWNPDLCGGIGVVPLMGGNDLLLGRIPAISSAIQLSLFFVITGGCIGYLYLSFKLTIKK